MRQVFIAFVRLIPHLSFDMQILSSSPNLLQKVFASSDSCFREVSMPSLWHAFAWDDEMGEAHCFETNTEESSISGDEERGEIRRFCRFKHGIIEEYARSSQFDRLRNWSGPAVFALALDGSGFHGQYDRIWQTGTGNLYLSLALPVHIPVSCARAIQFLPALVIAREINNLGGEGYFAEIKAPNDVVIRLNTGPKSGIPHKIAGTLTELRVLGDVITQVRYGIGMNLTHAPQHTDPGHLPAIALEDFEPSVVPDNPFHYFNYFLYTILSGIQMDLFDEDFMKSGICRFMRF